ncbi:MAG: FAD-binding oxidoreductase [Acidobacteriota bacterium]
MKTRYGVSYWLDRFPKARQPSYPRLRGALDVQVAVIGGGMTGCITAHAFAAAGVRVALVESARIGQGSTGACPGLLRLEPAVPFRILQERHGLRAARMIWQSFRRAGLEFAAAIRRLGIRCELAPNDALRVGFDEDDERPLRREMRALRDAKLDASWLTSPRLLTETGLSGVGALRSRRDGHVDPYRATLGFAAAAARRGGAVFERSPVTRVRPTGKAVEITADGGMITAEQVVVTSNYPLPSFRQLRRHFKLVDAYCVLTPPLPSFARRELGTSRAIVIDQEQPNHMLRRTSDHRLLFVGADQPHVPPRSRDKVIVQRTGQLMYELSKLYPAISGIKPEYGWDVPIAVAADGLPCAGAHRNFPRHLFALGAGHNGVAAAYLAARALLRQYLGHPEKGDDLLGFTRLLG